MGTLGTSSVALVAVLTLVACSDSSPRPREDGGSSTIDSSTPSGTDSGPRRDSGGGGGDDDGGGSSTDDDGGGGETSCATATTCGDCTAMGPCGFCNSTGTCMEGGSDGPTGGTCADWSWISGECPGFCEEATTCEECTPRGGCGFCGATGACMRGTGTGPAEGACASDWAWLSSECAGGGDEPDAG
jgi:hypothetical protein